MTIALDWDVKPQTKQENLYFEARFAYDSCIFLQQWQEVYKVTAGAQWLSGRVLDTRPKGCGFELHRRHCVVILEQDTFILAQYWFNPESPIPV